MTKGLKVKCGKTEAMALQRMACLQVRLMRVGSEA